MPGELNFNISSLENQSSKDFVQPLGKYEDLIFSNTYEPLDYLSYHQISPQKVKQANDLQTNEIIRHYNCFEANDIDVEGFPSVLFLTPPTLLDDDF